MFIALLINLVLEVLAPTTDVPGGVAAYDPQADLEIATPCAPAGAAVPSAVRVALHEEDERAHRRAAGADHGAGNGRGRGLVGCFGTGDGIANRELVRCEGHAGSAARDRTAVQTVGNQVRGFGPGLEADQPMEVNDNVYGPGDSRYAARFGGMPSGSGSVSVDSVRSAQAPQVVAEDELKKIDSVEELIKRGPILDTVPAFARMNGRQDEGMESTGTIKERSQNDAPATPNAAPERVVRRDQKGRQETRPVESLRANDVNRGLFTTSLQQPSIEGLTRSIQAHGLRHSILVREDGLILDGERRWLAVSSLGWEAVDVVVMADQVSDDQVADIVLDAFASTRDASVEERVNVYNLGKDVYQLAHGRPRGRPAKSSPDEKDYWDAETIYEHAASVAGLGSYKTADKAVKVFREGSEELKEKVNNGEISVSAAYAMVCGATPRGTRRTRETETTGAEVDNALKDLDALDGRDDLEDGDHDGTAQEEAAPVDNDSKTTAPEAPTQPDDAVGEEHTLEVTAHEEGATTVEHLVAQLTTRLRSQPPDADGARRIVSEVAAAAGVTKFWAPASDAKASLAGLMRAMQPEFFRYCVSDLDRAEKWLDDMYEALDDVVSRRHEQLSASKGRG